MFSRGSPTVSSHTHLPGAGLLGRGRAEGQGDEVLVHGGVLVHGEGDDVSPGQVPAHGVVELTGNSRGGGVCREP